MKPQITGITDNDLGDLMSAYASWKEYTEDLLLYAVQEATSAAEDLEYARKKMLLTTSGKNRDERNARIDTEDRIHELDRKWLEADMYREMLSSKLESINGAISVISREITRRGQTWSNR